MDVSNVRFWQNAIKQPSGYISNVLLALMPMLLIYLAWSFGVESGYDIADISFRYPGYAIPITMSEYLGKTHDYTAYKAIHQMFVDGGMSINMLITKAMALDPNQLINTKLWFIPVDDMGLVDFTRLGFNLFGAKQESIYHVYFLILSISACIFTINYFIDRAKLAFLCIALLSLYVVSYTCFITNQSVNITEPRFLGSLAIIPLFHLLFAIAQDQRYSLRNLICMALQAAILVFVYFVRTSELWQIASVCLFAVSIAAIRVRSLRQTAKILTPIFFIIICMLCLQLYKHYTIHPEYFAKNSTEAHSTKHTTWHNILMGLALHPKINAEYNLRILDDVATLEAVNTFLKKTGDFNSGKDLYNENYYLNNHALFDWDTYDSIAKQLYWQIVKAHPLWIAELYFIKMPTVLYANIFYMARNEAKVPHSELIFKNIGVHTDQFTREKRDLYYNLFRVEVLYMLVAMAILLMFSNPAAIKNSLYKLIGLATFVFSLALLSPMLVAPVIQYIQLSLLLITISIYLLILVTMIVALELIKTRVKLNVPAEAC